MDVRLAPGETIEFVVRSTSYSIRPDYGFTACAAAPQASSSSAGPTTDQSLSSLSQTVSALAASVSALTANVGTLTAALSTCSDPGSPPPPTVSGRRIAEQDPTSDGDDDNTAGVSSDGAARTLVSDYLKQHPELADRLAGLTSEERRRELRAHMEALGELFGLPAPA